jgi:hypothetical protein
LESSLPEDYFWFPKFADVKFRGRIEKEESDTLYLESSSLEKSVKIEKILKNREIVIHGVLHNSISATFIVMLIHKKENLRFLSNNYLLALNFRILYAYYGYHFNRTEDIKFNSLIVAFKGLQRWISYNDVFRGKQTKNTLRLGNKLIDIYYRLPITNRDHKISSRSDGKVIYVEIKSSKSMKFKDLLIIKSIIQDFFNFFITGESVITNSVYGKLNNNSKSNVITVEYRSPINERMNKSRVRTPVLITYSEIHTNLETLIKKFSRFRKKANTAYNYYFSEMYQGTLPLELRFFC